MTGPRRCRIRISTRRRRKRKKRRPAPKMSRQTTSGPIRHELSGTRSDVELQAIAIRCLFAYGFLLLMTRLSGKHTVSEATPFDFVLALILGDIIDDVILAEVEVARFVAAAGTLIFLDVLTTLITYRSARMTRW